jgi:hypothetical protein
VTGAKGFKVPPTGNVRKEAGTLWKHGENWLDSSHERG